MKEDMTERLLIRPLAATDSFAELTGLLNRAYQAQDERGIYFTAATQDEAATRRRALEGRCFVALDGVRIVGTVTAYDPSTPSECVWYQRAEVWRFGQFGVEPDYQNAGVGSRLMIALEAAARQAGARELALDTAEHATELIAFYQRRGFRPVGDVHWDDVDYRSVVLSKTL